MRCLSLGRIHGGIVLMANVEGRKMQVTNRWLMILVVALVVPWTLLGEVPSVRGVSPQRLSPGVRADIYGAGLGREATVLVGGMPAAVLGYEKEEVAGYLYETLRVQIPVEVALGPTTLDVTYAGAPAAPFPVTIDQYSPEILSTPGSCEPGRNLQPGDRASLRAIGLGATNPAVPTGVAAPKLPLAHTLATPTVTLGGEQVEVLESVLSPEEVGVYRVTFKVPARIGFQQTKLGIGGAISSAAYWEIPVGDLILHSGPRYNEGVPGSSPRAGVRGPAAPDSIMTAYSCGAPLVNGAEVYAGDAGTPPTILGGITITVKDSLGVERPAPLLYAFPRRDFALDRVDYIVPSGSAEGRATVTLTRPDGTVSTGHLDIQTIAPRLFDGFAAAPAAFVVRVRAGVSSVEQVIERAPPFWIPIDLGPETDQVFLVLFGTGWRNRRSPGDLSVWFRSSNDVRMQLTEEVEYAGAQGEYAGLDQLNLRLPRNLAGRGFLHVRLEPAPGSFDDGWRALLFK